MANFSLIHLANGVPLGHLKRAGAVRLYGDGILRGVPLGQILIIRRIVQNSDDRHHVLRADHLLGKGLRTALIDNCQGVWS